MAGKAKLSDASLAVKIAMLDVEKGGMSAILGGHTVSVGQEESNLALSRQRAKPVVAAFAQNGVLKGRMLAVGYGQTEPIADNATAEARAKSRRTTIEWVTR